MEFDASFYSYETEKVFPIVTSGSNEIFVFKDQSTRIAQYIIAKSLQEEYIVNVYAVSEEDVVLHGNSLIAKLNKGNLRAQVIPGFSHVEDHVVDFEGDYGRLVLQTYMPDGGIHSDN